MQVEKNKVVTLHYRLQDSDVKGDLIEETFGKDPLVFLYGAGNMIPEFEKQLKGKEKGDQVSFEVSSDQAYGEFHPDAVVTVSKSAFVLDGKVAEELLVVGKSIPMRDNEGNQLFGQIKEIRDNEVIMDFNHPMAGRNLFFTVQIEEVREATESEIAHGHVHGPDGEDH